MTDTYARQRQLIGSTAEWAANDLVLGDGELAVETVSATEIKIKVGNGTDKFSVLPYVAGGTTGSSGTLDPAVITELAKYVKKANGQMTGPLTLMTPLVPQPNHAISKDWIEKNITQVLTTGTVFAQIPDVIAGTATNKAVTPSSLKAIGIATSTGKPDAGKLIQTDTDGKIDHSLLDETVTGGTTTENGKLVALKPNGTIDISLLGAMAGGMTFKGTVDVTMPAPTGAKDGWFYFVKADGTANASWGLGTIPMDKGDAMIWGDGKWHVLKVETGILAFLMLDGSTPMLDTASITFDTTTAKGTAGGASSQIIIHGAGGTIDDVILDAGEFT